MMDTSAPSTPVPQSSTARDTRGRFQPGQSGNPAGKKPGTLNHATRLKLLLADDAYDAIAAQLIEAATKGHLPSIRFLMARLVPKPRGHAIALDLPAGATRAERLTALVDQMCAGEISPEEAKAMIAVLDKLPVAQADRAPPPARADRASRSASGDRAPEATPGDRAPEATPGRQIDRAVVLPSHLHLACIPASAHGPARRPGLQAALLNLTSLCSPAGDPGPAFNVQIGAAAAEAVARWRQSAPSAQTARPFQQAARSGASRCQDWSAPPRR